MLPFPVEIRPGIPVADQVIFHAKKAIVCGLLKAGQKFPSIRQLSADLRINHNTAQRIITTLVTEGVLVTTPAVGSVVAEMSLGPKADRAELMGRELERLVVEARKLGLEIDEVQKGLLSHWKRMGGKPQQFESRTEASDASKSRPHAESTK